MHVVVGVGDVVTHAYEAVEVVCHHLMLAWGAIVGVVLHEVLILDACVVVVGVVLHVILHAWGAIVGVVLHLVLHACVVVVVVVHRVLLIMVSVFTRHVAHKAKIYICGSV